MSNIVHSKVQLTTAQYELQERKRQAYHLSLRGYSTKQISIALGVSRSTVSSYLRDRQEALTEAMGELNPMAFTADVMEDFAQLRVEAWKALNEAQDATQRRAAITLIASLREKEMKTLKTIGVFEDDSLTSASKGSNTVNVNVNGPFQVNLSENRLDALSAILCAQQMGVSPEEALGMRGRKPTFVEKQGDHLQIVEPPQEPFMGEVEVETSTREDS